MSSYWAGYYGEALVLSPKEFNAFIKKYAAKQHTSVDDINNFIDTNGLNEYEFIKSEKTSDSDVFYITDIRTDDCDGMCLIPHFIDGHKNIYIIDKTNGKIDIKQEQIHKSYGDCYVLFSDHNRMGPDAFETHPYPTYDALVQEFKHKLKDYLPDDFEWDAHIGQFSYAAYA